MNNRGISAFVVDDEESYLHLLHTSLTDAGYDVTTAGDGVEAINILQTRPFDLALLDMKMPRVDGLEVLKFIKDRYLDTQVIMLTGVNDVRLVVECMQLGAYSYLTKPYTTGELLALLDRATERKRLSVENKVLKSALARYALSGNIIGNSKPMLEMLSIAAKVAPTDSTILVQGPSGTGKELVANFLHRNSLRKEQQFVALNCATIPETLIESELFGHEKGAFTDAIATKQGLVEIATGGTLFLDEIAELTVMVQPKLLRFLQTGEFRRVGGNKTLKADVRVISATNKDLKEETAAGRFREDLLYRLNVITLEVPHLKDRRQDVPLLVDHFLKMRIRTRGITMIDAKAMDLLMKYDWPGNVRELENVIERAGILCHDNLIRVEDIAIPIGARPSLGFGSPHTGGVRIGDAVSLRDLEKAHISGLLKLVQWNKATAAKILGISLKTLYTKIQQFNLNKD